MYAFNEHIQSISIQAANPASATVRNIPWFKVPRPVTIKAAFAVSESGLLTATPATQALAMALLNGDTAGTATLTIGTFGTSTTPYTWTARQGYAATFGTTSLQDIAANQWVVAQHSEIGSSSGGVLTICVHHVEGTGRIA